MEQVSTYEKLTPTLLLQLAAPHTWPAAILPVLVGTALAVHDAQSVSFSLTFVILIIVICLQSAVNLLNDYFDFKKGADTKENQTDKNDAILVFHAINPRTVKRIALCLVVVSFVLGSYVIYCAGWIPLVLGIIGAAIVFLYSGGKLPISYIPLGELASGFTMGTLIVVATYQALTLTLTWQIFVCSVPLLIGIGLILMTNNTCDIEKDIDAGRKTLSVLLGREKARVVYRVALYCMITTILVLTALWWKEALLLVPFMLLILFPFVKTLSANPLTLSTRTQAMGQIVSINIIVGVFYAAFILCDCFCVITL